MVVLDASAVLAAIQEEPGGGVVEAVLDGAVITAVNWSEVAQKLAEIGLEPQAVYQGLLGMGVVFCDADLKLADTAAALFPYTKRAGLSLGDRFCVAKGLLDDAEILTADKAWKRLDVGARIQLIR